MHSYLLKSSQTIQLKFPHMLIWLISLFLISSAVDLNIPLDSLHWQKTKSGSWIAQGDSIKIFGTSYRVGNLLMSRQAFDMSQAEIFMKLSVDGAGQYMGIQARTTYLNPGIFFTTHHTYSNSILIQDNIDYYFHLQAVDHGDSLIYTVSTGNYDTNGGTIFYQNKFAANQNYNYVKKADYIVVTLFDNYDDSNCHLTLKEVIIKNTTEYQPQFTDSTIYNFENGTIPEIFETDTNYWSVAYDTVSSSNCMYASAPKGIQTEFGFRITSPCKISFDEKFISYYDWNPERKFGFSVDGYYLTTFDESNIGDWFHYEIYIPDTAVHYISWRVRASNYVSQNSEAFVDNLVLSGGQILGIESGKPTNTPSTIQLSQNYPNPFNPSTHIEYQIPYNGQVELSIFNILGEKIATLVNDYQQAGNYKVRFDIQGAAPDIPSGIYIYQLQFKGDNGKSMTINKKMIMIK